MIAFHPPAILSLIERTPPIEHDSMETDGKKRIEFGNRYKNFNKMFKEAR